MSRIDRIIVILTCLLGILCAPVRAQQQTIDVSLLLGDTDSLTAIEAIRILRSDPALARVRFHAYPANRIDKRDLSAFETSRLAFVQTVGWNLARAVAPQIEALNRSGGKAFAVGPTWDDQLRSLGLLRDDALTAYMTASGPGNVANMVRAALARELGLSAPVAPPAPLPEFGALDLDNGRIAANFEEFRDHYSRYKPGRPWVGVPFYRTNAVSGQTETVRALAAALEAKGLNVIPFFGFPLERTLERFAFDSGGQPAVAALGALSMKIGAIPETLGPVLQRLGAPAVNLITLNSQTRAQWEASPQGLDILERVWQIGGPELGGLVAPTVVASKEPWVDPDTGIEALRETAIPDRIDRAAERIAAWVALRETPNPDKRVALLYYNYPPGREAIGASYLNVLPGSLWQMLTRLQREGYRTDGLPEEEDGVLEAIRDHGGNIGNWNPGTLELLVREGLSQGAVQLLPVATYRQWFVRDVPASLRQAMIEKWGEPETSSIMVWKDDKGTPYFVFPARRYGNVLLAPQPSRGWEQDVAKLYHDVSLPPHHQYLAFYLWLQNEFHANAMVHIGTHATHEWLGGKEIGFSNADPGELIAGSVPQLYPYIVDDVGEAIQAKRRGMAAIISHMTPPIDKASLSPQLKELTELISNLAVAKQKSPDLASGILAELQRKASSQGILKDMGLEQLDEDNADQLDDYIREISEKATPFGLHTFGVSPDANAALATAEAILSQETIESSRQKLLRTESLVSLLQTSANAELDAFTAALAGAYVAAGPGNDPIRNPDSLPTGRDLYGFDPSRMPSPATYAMGEGLARKLVDDFHASKGEWPNKFVFNLWGVESSRHEGVMEAQILYLMGIRPQWDARGKVIGVEPIARSVLGRPRVDVTIIPSGLYRDMFPIVMKLLDEAVTLAKAQDEPDNAIRNNIVAMRKDLVEQGLSEQRAEQLASVRVFSVPSGAYGTNLDKIIPLSNTYGSKGKEADDKLSDVFFMRMHHAFGQGLWGASVDDRPNLAVDLFTRSLKGAQAVVHSRSSNIYASLDGDDFYQYLGGTAMAIRKIDGKSPDVLVTNMAVPNQPKNETLERYMGREMRARYLNPKWIEKMMAEGYAGAAFVDRVVENLYGWQVTVPEAVGDEKWQEMFETWVEDRNHLDIKQKFRDAGNLLAYQALIDRMIVAINKGYWKANPATIAALKEANLAVIAEAGVACSRDTCSSTEITALAEVQDRRDLQGALRLPAPGADLIQANVSAARALPTASRPSQSLEQQSADALKQTASTTRPPAIDQPTPSPAKVEGFAVEERTTSFEHPDAPPSSHAATVMSGILLLGFASRLLLTLVWGPSRGPLREV